MLYTSLNRHLSIIPTHCSTNGRGVQARNLTAALSNTARSSNLTVKATATNKLSNTVDTGTGAGRRAQLLEALQPQISPRVHPVQKLGQLLFSSDCPVGPMTGFATALIAIVTNSSAGRRMIVTGNRGTGGNAICKIENNIRVGLGESVGRSSRQLRE